MLYSRIKFETFKRMLDSGLIQKNNMYYFKVGNREYVLLGKDTLRYFRDNDYDFSVLLILDKDKNLTSTIKNKIDYHLKRTVPKDIMMKLSLSSKKFKLYYKIQS